MKQHTTRGARLAGIIETTAVLVIFYQALRVLFSVLFGAIYDALFAETVPMTEVGLILVAVIVALLAPLIAPRQPRTRRVTALACGALVFLARIPLTLNNPQARLVASILIVAAAGVYLATRLRAAPRDAVRALFLALVADQFLRAMGHTWDRDAEGGVVAMAGGCLAGALPAGCMAVLEAAGRRDSPGPRLGYQAGPDLGWLAVSSDITARISKRYGTVEWRDVLAACIFAGPSSSC